MQRRLVLPVNEARLHGRHVEVQVAVAHRAVTEQRLAHAEVLVTLRIALGARGQQTPQVSAGERQHAVVEHRERRLEHPPGLLQPTLCPEQMRHLRVTVHGEAAGADALPEFQGPAPVHQTLLVVAVERLHAREHVVGQELMAQVRRGFGERQGASRVRQSVFEPVQEQPGQPAHGEVRRHHAGMAVRLSQRHAAVVVFERRAHGTLLVIGVPQPAFGAGLAQGASGPFGVAQRRLMRFQAGLRVALGKQRVAELQPGVRLIGMIVPAQGYGTLQRLHRARRVVHLIERHAEPHQGPSFRLRRIGGAPCGLEPAHRLRRVTEHQFELGIDENGPGILGGAGQRSAHQLAGQGQPIVVDLVRRGIEQRRHGAGRICEIQVLRVQAEATALKERGGTGVQSPALTGQHALIDAVADEGVVKVPLSVPPHHQRGIHRGVQVRRPGGHRFERFQREMLPEHARRANALLNRRRQRLELGHRQALNAVGQAVGPVTEAHELFEKQRVAPRPVEQRLEVLRAGAQGAGQTLCIRRPQRAQIQGQQRRFPHSGPPLGVQRLSSHPGRHQQHHRQLGHRPGQPREHREGQAVGPVEIVHHEHLGAVTGRHPHQGGQRLGGPLHALVGRQAVESFGAVRIRILAEQSPQIRHVVVAYPAGELASIGVLAGDGAHELRQHVLTAGRSEVVGLGQVDAEALLLRQAHVLTDEPALADAGLAADQQRAAVTAVAAGIQHRHELPNLHGPTHQRRRIARRPRAPAACAGNRLVHQ